jgi:hypothetical protein
MPFFISDARTWTYRHDWFYKFQVRQHHSSSLDWMLPNAARHPNDRREYHPDRLQRNAGGYSQRDKPSFLLIFVALATPQNHVRKLASEEES